MARCSLARPPKWSAMAAACSVGRRWTRCSRRRPFGATSCSRSRLSPSRCSVAAAPRRSSTSSSVRRDISAWVSLGRAPRRQVVGDHEVELVVDLAVQLVELQAQQPGVDAELDDHRLDLVADAVHHLAALHDGDDVAQRHDVLQLDAGEVGDGVVEAHLVALERLQRLVGPVEQAADVLQLVLRAAGVDVDDAHLLAGRHDRHAQRAGDPLGGAVAGAGLAGGHRRVGDEVHVGPGDAAAVGRDDDGAVHLGQLGQPLRAVRGVDEEAAGADGQHVGLVVEHEQGAGLGPHDPVDAVAQRRARGDPRQGVAQSRRWRRGTGWPSVDSRGRVLGPLTGARCPRRRAPRPPCCTRTRSMPSHGRRRGRARWPGGTRCGPPRRGGGGRG